MVRPIEYDNLVKAGSFKDVPSNPEFVNQYLVGAHALLLDASRDIGPPSRYILAYDAFFGVVQAVLDFHGVRTTDNRGHRTIAIQRVAADLKLTPGELKMVTDAHNRRNQITYTSPIPPILKAEADALLKIANTFLQRACTILGKSFPP